jgi:uncharacterized membrane protein (DUF106 family)
VSKTVDARIGWVLALLALVGGVAVSIGFSTPAQKMDEVKNEQKVLVDAFQKAQKDQAAKDAEQDIRLERLELMGDRIEDIAEAVGAEKKRRRRGR